MKTVKVSVTKEDILNGSQRSPNECPVALACSRALKRRVHIATNETGVYGRAYLGPKNLSRRTIAAIKKYDGGGTMKPFTFQVKIPK